MGRKKLNEVDGLLYDVKTRINQQHFDRLNKQLASSPYRKMSELLRDIICNRPITVYTVDNSLPQVMEELTRIRKELNSIGRNVNQVTREFHTAAGRAERVSSVFQLLEYSKKVDQRLEIIFPIISQLSEKWLRG
ncbi:plasmid mobilization protein [Chitinophaga arvensicola]|uniref:Mobilisation protein (MobC) n=1 Tax=Chitinophaga arvensicola TaxID=29529 RepID=A0A1I0PLX5_9BACT|nr:hypothetical protein [Chitinophaga arvensicola]SEW15225.1 hypothetical protein SAMN04488122_0852 [Chitinophaga arvensicola]